MRKKIALTSLLLAWLCANGGLLDAVQIVAWGRMFSGYAQTMAVTAALRETFDPAKPCEMCVGVAHAKEDLGQKNLPATAERHGEKLILALDVPAGFILVKMPDAWPPAGDRAAPTRTETVPVPPPRV